MKIIKLVIETEDGRKHELVDVKPIKTGCHGCSIIDECWNLPGETMICDFNLITRWMQFKEIKTDE